VGEQVMYQIVLLVDGHVDDQGSDKHDQGDRVGVVEEAEPIECVGGKRPHREEPVVARDHVAIMLWMKILWCPLVYMSHIIFKEVPTDNWLNDLVVRASTDDTKLLIGKYMSKNKVVVKLTVGDRNSEYVSLSLLKDNTSTYSPNLPVIYGTMSCYETKQNLEENFKRVKGKGICYGNKKEQSSQKIYMSVIGYIDAKTMDALGNIRLADDQVLSLMMQGLYTIYQLYYVFGILHRDFNGGNILIGPTSKKELVYKIACSPYRFFAHELDDAGCFKDACNKKVETNGVRLYLIDFDQATIYHNKYNKSDTQYTVIEDANKFITQIMSLGSNELYAKYQEIKSVHFDNFKQTCIRRQSKYIQEKTDYSNCHMLDRTTISLRVYIDIIIMAFGLPCTYRI
jgi:serine/threonine protein kinase